MSGKLPIGSNFSDLAVAQNRGSTRIPRVLIPRQREAACPSAKIGGGRHMLGNVHLHANRAYPLCTAYHESSKTLCQNKQVKSEPMSWA